MAHRTATAAAIALLFLACGPGTSDGGGNAGPATQQLTIQVSGHGSVQISTGQQCKDRCVVSVGKSTKVSATASPEDGWMFSGWSGSCGGSSACQFTVEADMELDAAFALKPTGPNQHILTAARNGSGNIKSSPAGIDCGASCSAGFLDGTSVSLAAAPDSGWRFDGWGGGCSGPGSCVVQIAADVTVWATFVKLPPPPHTLTVALAGSGAGRVSSSPPGIDCGKSCSAAFPEGTSVKLTAAAAQGSTFTGWSGACSGTGDCEVQINADSSVTATFDLQPPDECAALRPPDAGPAKTRHVIQSVADCGPGVTDGSGTLALWVDNVSPMSNSVLDFVSPTGDVLQSSRGNAVWLTGQLSGFEGYAYPTEGSGSTVLRAWDTNGNQTAQTAPGPDATYLVEDPLGGVVVWRMQGPPGSHVIESYDERLNLRWTVLTPGSGDPGAISVDRAGRTLALWGADANTAPKAVDGLWVDHDGNASPIFRALPPQSDWAHLMGYVLAPRVGDGLFLMAMAHWIGQFDSGSTSMAPPPEWLTARPQTSLHMVHGGTGYAVLPPSAGSCTKSVEVIAPSGKSCGSASFAADSTSCTAANPAVGYDGTVILEFLDNPDQCHPGGTCTCTWQWWPGFFR